MIVIIINENEVIKKQCLIEEILWKMWKEKTLGVRISEWVTDLGEAGGQHCLYYVCSFNTFRVFANIQ